MAEKVSQPPKHTYGPHYARQRKETEFDLLDIAIDLKRRVARYIMNEKYVPKRWRYIEGLPTLEYARAIRDNISDANNVRIDTAILRDVTKRRDFQFGALAACNKLQEQLDDIIEECDGATDESMRAIINDLTQLVRRIPKWIASDSQRLNDII